MTGFDKDSFKDSVHRDVQDLKDSIHRDIHDRIHDRMQNCGYRFPAGTNHGIIWGGAICVVGIILLLDHLGFVSADHLWKFWPLLLILVGAINLNQVGQRARGAFFVIFGVLFLLNSLELIRFRWDEFWPLAIIAAGVMMIWGSVEARRRRTNFPDTANTMDVNAIFGGIERRVTARDFKFGRVNAVFGGIELDFHDADIEGEQAEIEVNAIFGGVEIRVPDNWHVEPRTQTIFGALTDTTRRNTGPSDPNAPSGKTLVISGSAVFGGIEVKN